MGSRLRRRPIQDLLSPDVDGPRPERSGPDHQGPGRRRPRQSRGNAENVQDLPERKGRGPEQEGSGRGPEQGGPEQGGGGFLGSGGGLFNALGGDLAGITRAIENPQAAALSIAKPVITGALESAPQEVGELIGAASEMGVGGGPMDWLGDLVGGAPGGEGGPPGGDGGPMQEGGPRGRDSKAPGDGPPGEAGAPPASAPGGGGGGMPGGAPGNPAGGDAPEARGGSDRTRPQAAAPGGSAAPRGGGGGGGGGGMPGGGGGGPGPAQPPGGPRAQLTPARPSAGRRAPSQAVPSVADPTPALGSAPSPALAPLSGGAAAPSFRPETGGGQAAASVQPGTINDRQTMELPAPSGMEDCNFDIPDYRSNLSESAPRVAGVADRLFAEASDERLIAEAVAAASRGPSGEGIVGGDTGLRLDAVRSVDNTVNVNAAGQAPSAGGPIGGESTATPISGAGQLNTAASQVLPEQAPPDLGTLDTSSLIIAPAEGSPTGAAVSALPSQAPLQVSTPRYPGGSDNLPSASAYTPATPSTETDQAVAQQTLTQEAAALDPLPAERLAQIENDIAPQQAQGQAQLAGPTQQSQTDAQGAITRGGAVQAAGQSGMTDASSQLSAAVAAASTDGAAALQEACVSPQPAGLTGGTPDQISGPLGARQGEMLEAALPDGPVNLEMPPGAVAAMESANADLLDTLGTSVDPTPRFDQLISAELPEPGFAPPAFEEAVDTEAPQINPSLPAPSVGGGGGVPTPIEGAGAMAAIEGEISAQSAQQTTAWQEAVSGNFEDGARSSFEATTATLDERFTGTADHAQDVHDDYRTSRPDVEPADQAAAAEAAFQRALDDSVGAQSEMSGSFESAQGDFDATSLDASGAFSGTLSDAHASHLDATTQAGNEYAASYEQASATYAAEHGAALGTMQGSQAGAMQGAQEAWSAEQAATSDAMSQHQASFEQQRGGLDVQAAQARTQAQSTLDADVARYQAQARGELDSQMASARAQVDGQVSTGMGQVEAELQSGVDGFENEIQTGVDQAESERQSAESEASRKREEGQGGFFSAIGDAISKAWNAICSWVSERFEAAKNAINGFLEAAKNAALSVLEAARSAALGILEGIRDAVHGIISAVCDALRSFISAIADALRSAIQMVVAFVSAAVQFIAAALNTLIEAFQSMVNALVQGLVMVVSLIDEDLGAKLSAAADVFLGAFNSLCDVAQSTVQSAADSLTAQVQAAGDALSSTITAAEDALVGAIDTAEGALHAATDAALDIAVGAVNAAFDLASAAITAAFDLARAAVTAWFDAQLALIEAAREWVEARIHDVIGALQAAGEWLSDRWEDLKDFAAEAWVWMEKGLVTFWNSAWRDVILGALLTAVAIGVVALIAATGGLALPLVIGITAAVTGATAAAVYGGGELAARRAYVDLATNHGEYMIPESQMMEDPNNPGQMIPDPSLAANDWYSDTLGSVERNPDGTMSYMRDGERITVDPTDEAAVREMAAYGFARDEDGNLIGESVGDSLNDSAALAAAKGTEWAISGAVIAATGGLMPTGTAAQPLSTAARVGYSMLIDGGLSTVSDVVTQPLTSAIQDSIDSDERGFGDSLSEWAETRTHERVPIKDADGNIVGYARGDELSGWEIAGQEALSAGVNVATAGAGGWAEGLTSNREFRSQATEFVTEQAIQTTEGGVSEALTYTVNSLSGRSQQDFSLQGLMNSTLQGAAGSGLQGAASHGTTHLGTSLGHSVSGVHPTSNTTGGLQPQDTGPATEQSTSTNTADLDAIIDASIMESAGLALLNTSDADTASADQANVVDTASTDTVTVGDTTLDTSSADRIEVSSDAATVEATSGDTSQTIALDADTQGTESTPTPVLSPQEQQQAAAQAAAQTPRLEQTPIQQRIDGVTGVERGGDYDTAMSDMRTFYEQMAVEAQQNHSTVQGTAQDGPYGWNYGYDTVTVNGRTHVTIKVHLDGDTNSISSTDLAQLRADTVAGVDTHYNNQHDLTSSDGSRNRLHVEVEFVSNAADSHLSVEVHPEGGRSNLSNWHVGDGSIIAAHELGHQLSLKDEYIDASVPTRQDATAPGVHHDSSLMGNFYRPDGSIDPNTTLHDRHLSQLQADIESSKTPGVTPEVTPGSNAQSPHAPLLRTPPPEVQSKADDVLATLDQMLEQAQHSGTEKTVAEHQAAAVKVRQILTEQSPGITDAMKLQFFTDYQARLTNNTAQDAGGFSIIRDLVNEASVKDESGKVQSNPYLRQGENISLEALQDAGSMSRLYGTEKVYNMLTPEAQYVLQGQGILPENFGQYLQDNPDYDINANFDSSANVEGYNNTAWWGLQKEGKADNISALIDALALDPKYYPQGGVRFNISPETAHSTGMTKPTAFDGMFPEWVPTSVSNPFGMTGGGKQEGVASRIPFDQVEGVEVFAGAPEQLKNPSPKLPNAPTPQGQDTTSRDPRVIRQDNDFSAPDVVKQGRTSRKSHLDSNGNLHPANPDGVTTPLQHIIGGIDEKNDSPYSSFMTVEDGVQKSYGSQEIQVDIQRLTKDLARKQVSGVEVLPPERIQQQILADLVDLGFEVHAVQTVLQDALSSGDIAGVIDFVRQSALSRKKQSKAERRIIALYNTSRDQEVLIKGVIPSDYINQTR